MPPSSEVTCGTASLAPTAPSRRGPSSGRSSPTNSPTSPGRGGKAMNHAHDVIVVGARCAGAPTAMLLARQGHDVLLVDRATFPSDTLSTLVIHASGVSALRRWGVL